MKFFISDTHFGHKKIIEYAKRPFKTVEEMDEVLIANWNEVVGVGDAVYHLGDFGLTKDVDKILKRLNGQIFLISGDYDKEILKHKELFVKVDKMLTVKEQGERIVLCHYPMRTWSQSHYGSWHLHGHSHGQLPPQGKSWDVSVEAIGYKPLSFDELRIIMRDRPVTELAHDYSLDWEVPCTCKGKDPRRNVQYRVLVDGLEAWHFIECPKLRRRTQMFSVFKIGDTGSFDWIIARDMEEAQKFHEESSGPDCGCSVVLLEPGHKDWDMVVKDDGGQYLGRLFELYLKHTTCPDVLASTEW